MNNQSRMQIFQCFSKLINNKSNMYFFQDSLCYNVMQIRLHEFEYKINIFIILCFYCLIEFNDIGVIYLFQYFNLTICSLSISRVLKSVKYFFKRVYSLTNFILHFPNMTISSRPYLLNHCESRKNMIFDTGLLILRHQIQYENNNKLPLTYCQINTQLLTEIYISLINMLRKSVIFGFQHFVQKASLLTCGQVLRRRCLTYPIINGFAVIYKKPEKPMSISPVAIVIEWMDKLKDTTVSESQLKQAYQRINQPSFTQAEKVSLTKYLMSIMYKNNSSTEILLSSPTVKRIQQGHYFVQLETMMFIISREVMNSKANFTLVNNLYVDCFNSILPKVKDEVELIKCQVLLYKNFGKYMIQRGSKEKGIEAIEKAVSAHKQLILEEYKRMEYLIRIQNENTEQNRKKSKAEKQREKFQINALKENIRRLIQSMFEALQFYYTARKDEIKSISSPEERQKIIVTVCALINQHIKVKVFVPGLQLYSRHYHRLHQVYLELEYSYALSKKDAEKVKQARLRIKQFIQSSMRDIQESKQHLQVQKQIVKTILSLQLHLSRVQKGNNPQQLKKDLTDFYLKMIQKGKMDQNQMTKQMTTKIFVQFMKRNFK